jgi:hypothetical protein
MYQIMEYDKDNDRWVPVSASYSGLTKAQANQAIKTLRRYAREDNSGMKYKMREVVIVPR